MSVQTNRELRIIKCRAKEIVSTVFTALWFVAFYYSTHNGDVARACVALFVGVIHFVYTFRLIIMEAHE